MKRSLFEQLDGFVLGYQQVQDWDLWLRAALVGELQQLCEVLCRYRVHDTNMSKNYRRLVQETTIIMRSNTKAGKQASSPEVVRAAKRGKRDIRLDAGHQAFDDFRVTRRIPSLLDALRFVPRFTVSTVIRHQVLRRK
jgi:hypothetical protein